jgi:hypothetical protein
MEQEVVKPNTITYMSVLKVCGILQMAWNWQLVTNMHTHHGSWVCMDQVGSNEVYLLKKNALKSRLKNLRNKSLGVHTYIVILF